MTGQEKYCASVKTSKKSINRQEPGGDMQAVSFVNKISTNKHQIFDIDQLKSIINVKIWTSKHYI